MKYTITFPNDAMVSVKGDRIDFVGTNIVIYKGIDVVAVFPSGVIITDKSAKL